MKVVIDIEANSLNNPTQIWLIVCKDIDTNQLYIYRNVTTDEKEKLRFLTFSRDVETWIGHNFLGYDYPNLNRLISLQVPRVYDRCYDTLVLSKLFDYSRKAGHSIEAYGKEMGLEKIHFNDWTKWSQEMEDYCVRDVEIGERIYNSFLNAINDPKWSPAIRLEQQFQLVVNDLHSNGFSFNVKRCNSLLSSVKKELETLDKEIHDGFPPRLRLVREVTPRYTQHGTLHRGDFRWVEAGDLTQFNGGPFCRCSWQSFNPSSHNQVIDVLTTSGWSPTDKTQTHIEADRDRSGSLLTDKLLKYGWKINETNLATLPTNAPKPARTLAKRILYESRRRTLTEWLGLADEDERIHGKFIGIGAWTHRMAHQQPNTANIPNDLNGQGHKVFLGKEMRGLWQAPVNRLLLGVDAEGIQLRIFAHYIDEKEFTNALVNGRKEDKSDPHSLNQRILGEVCRSRQSAKRFVYALLLGAGLGKLGEILEASKLETERALDRLLERYQGFARLKQTRIPADAKRGWFLGLDGRRVPLPGDSASERRHLCMSGYLQNGEAIIMKRACLKWQDLLKEKDSILVNFVHDEWQTEVPDMETGLLIAARQADSLRIVGEELGLKCPLAGSYWNEDHKRYTIGANWSVTH